MKGRKERHKIAEERRASLLDEFLKYEYSNYPLFGPIRPSFKPSRYKETLSFLQRKVYARKSTDSKFFPQQNTYLFFTLKYLTIQSSLEADCPSARLGLFNNNVNIMLPSTPRPAK